MRRCGSTNGDPMHHSNGDHPARILISSGPEEGPHAGGRVDWWPRCARRGRYGRGGLMTTRIAQTTPALLPDHVVAEIVQIVQSRHGRINVARVRELAEREWARYHDARVRTFIPVLVRRAVVDHILAAGGPE